MITTNFRTFSCPPKDSVLISSHSPPPATCNHESALCLWICLFWSSCVSGILRYLVSVSAFLCNVFKIHPCHSVYENSIPFHDWITFHRTDVHFWLFVPWLTDIWLFRFLAIRKSAAGAHLCADFCVHMCSFLLSSYPRVELLSRMVILPFNPEKPLDKPQRKPQRKPPFFTVTALFYVWPALEEGSGFSTSLPALVTIGLL